MGRFRARDGVDMEREKEVGLVAVGNVGTTGEGDEYVGCARVNHLHVGAISLHIAPKGERILQRQILFVGIGPRRTIIATAMPRIDDEGEALAGCNHSQRKTKQCYQ